MALSSSQACCSKVVPHVQACIRTIHAPACSMTGNADGAYIALPVLLPPPSAEMRCWAAWYRSAFLMTCMCASP